MNEQAKPMTTNLAFYTAICLTALAGLTASSAGSSLEGVLTRMIVVMLISTIAGYLLSLMIWAMDHPTLPAQSTATPDGALEPVLQGRLNVLAGDDGSETDLLAGPAGAPAGAAVSPIAPLGRGSLGKAPDIAQRPAGNAAAANVK